MEWDIYRSDLARRNQYFKDVREYERDQQFQRELDYHQSTSDQEEDDRRRQEDDDRRMEEENSYRRSFDYQRYDEE